MTDSITGRCDLGISNLGAVYSVPPGMKYLEPRTSAYLAGSHEFAIDELEVY